MDESAMEEKFPCVKCGKLRTKNEGGTTFTICDACWKKKVADRFPPRCILDANELEMTGDAPAYLRIPNNGLHFRDNQDVDYLSVIEHQSAMDALRALLGQAENEIKDLKVEVWMLRKDAENVAAAKLRAEREQKGARGE